MLQLKLVLSSQHSRGWPGVIVELFPMVAIGVGADLRLVGAVETVVVDEVIRVGEDRWGAHGQQEEQHNH